MNFDPNLQIWPGSPSANGEDPHQAGCVDEVGAAAEASHAREKELATDACDSVENPQIGISIGAKILGVDSPFFSAMVLFQKPAVFSGFPEAF